MARIRSIHPGLFTDEAFMALSSDAQVFFLGLWTEADDQGVFEWKPLTLKVRLRGGKDGAVEALLDELAAVNSIQKYELGGRHYGAIRNFRKFQRPKKPNAIHPMTDEIRTYVALNAVVSEIEEAEEAPVPHQFRTGTEKSPQMEDGGGRMKDEGGKKNTSGAAPRPPAVPSPEFIRLPTNRFEKTGEEIVITVQQVSEFSELYPAVDVRQGLRNMRGWLIANPSKRKTKTGMLRFINTWLSRQQDQGSPNGTRAKRPSAHDNFIAGAALFIDSLSPDDEPGGQGTAGPDANGPCLPFLAA